MFGWSENTAFGLKCFYVLKLKSLKSGFGASFGETGCYFNLLIRNPVLRY